MIPARYRELLAQPGVAVAYAAGIAARLPVSMYALAVLLLVQRRTGSLADAGLVTACAATGYALAGPALARLADRRGPTRPLLATAAASAAAFVALVTVPVPAMAAVALLAGATLPPVAACQRALWPRLVPAGVLDTALAVDAMLLDAFLIAGPLLVTAVIALANPTAAILVTAALLTTGATWFALLPFVRAQRPSGRGRPDLAGPLRAAGIRTLVATIGLTGVALGSVRITLVGFAENRGNPDMAGLLYTALGIGSIAGGLWYGARTWRAPAEHRYTALLAIFGVAAPTLLAATSLPAMAALAAVAGLALAPVTIGEFVLVRQCAPDGTVTEAYAWAITATFAGGAAGTALAAALVDHAGWRAGVPLVSASLAVAAGTALIRRRDLRPGAVLAAEGGDLA